MAEEPMSKNQKERLANSIVSKHEPSSKAAKKKEEGGSNERRLAHIHIEPADNGFTVRHSLHVKDGEKIDGPPTSGEHQHVFQNKEDVADHVHGLLAKHC